MTTKTKEQLLAENQKIAQSLKIVYDNFGKDDLKYLYLKIQKYLPVEDRAQCLGLIHRRIGRSYVLEGYMLRNGHKKFWFEEATSTDHLEFRKAWLAMLINEHASEEGYIKARIRDFLIAWLKAAKHPKEPTQIEDVCGKGLCTNLKRWMGNSPLLSNTCDYFVDVLLDKKFSPFDRRGMCFGEEVELGIMHKNYKRIAWVKETIEQLTADLIKEPKV